MNIFLRQYAIISAAIIIAFGIEIFVPWPWSIMGGIPFILMLPVILKYTIMNRLGMQFSMQCMGCGKVTRQSRCPGCKGNAFKIV